MQKFIVIKEGAVKRVVVSDDQTKIALHEGESIQQALGKVKIGTKIVSALTPADVQYEKPRRSLKDIGIGAAIASALGAGVAAAHYFIGSL